MTQNGNNHWPGRPVLITGGASFIGSSIADRLVKRGARVRIVDDVTSGRLDNIRGHLANGTVDFLQADLREPGVTRLAVQGIDTIFHLAADHGGRGYVDLHQAGPASNFFLDGLVFAEAVKAGVRKVVFASSGCVYPNFLQSDVKKEVYLTEDLTKGPNDADNTYGWAKLMGEFTLQAYAREGKLKAASCRYFTVYGPRGVENHAVIAMIARAFINQNPFVVWGTGEQIRNWTYIDDIVSGTILAAEKIDDDTAVNLGTPERIKVIDAAKEVLRYMGKHAEFELHPEMPTGPLHRVAATSLAKKILGWEPKVNFIEGLHRTIDWYVSVKNQKAVSEQLQGVLTER